MATGRRIPDDPFASSPLKSKDPGTLDVVALLIALTVIVAFAIDRFVLAPQRQSAETASPLPIVALKAPSLPGTCTGAVASRFLRDALHRLTDEGWEDFARELVNLDAETPKA